MTTIVKISPVLWYFINWETLRQLVILKIFPGLHILKYLCTGL